MLIESDVGVRVGIHKIGKNREGSCSDNRITRRDVIWNAQAIRY